MVLTDTKTLRRQLEDARRMMKDVHCNEERVALANYIGNLYCSLICMGDYDFSFNRKKCFGGKKNYSKFIKKLDVYSDRLLQNFLVKKEFHKSYLGEIIPEVEEEMSWFCVKSFPIEDQFSPKDFREILYEFMKSIHQEELLSNLDKEGHIYSSLIGQDTHNLGFAIHNPINHCTDLFVKNFRYDLSSMTTLVHELGHGYDLSLFQKDVNEYNQYFYISFYGEVFARLFERLLSRFLLNEHIREDTVKDRLIDFEIVCHDFLLQAYVISLLDDEFLKSDEYIDCDSQVISKKIKQYFLEDADIDEFVQRMGNFDLAEAYNYAYGDIVSMFLCDEVLKNGFSSDLFEYFCQKRSHFFDEEFLRECGFGPANYVKLYQKEVSILHK